MRHIIRCMYVGCEGLPGQARARHLLTGTADAHGLHLHLQLLLL
jgi:hypothetical protein